MCDHLDADKINIKIRFPDEDCNLNQIKSKVNFSHKIFPHIVFGVSFFKTRFTPLPFLGCV